MSANMNLTYNNNNFFPFLSSSGFNQFGLYHDDCLYENDDVKEALRRLPAVNIAFYFLIWKILFSFQHLLDERAFRLQRAMQCNVQKTVLPKDQWPSYEEDREKGRYLQPYLDEVTRERKEKEDWAKQA